MEKASNKKKRKEYRGWGTYPKGMQGRVQGWQARDRKDTQMRAVERFTPSWHSHWQRRADRSRNLVEMLVLYRGRARQGSPVAGNVMHDAGLGACIT